MDPREFGTKALGETLDAIAPDGSQVRILLGLAAGGMAHFRLAPRQVSAAVTHRTIEEIWFIVEGEGEMWRRQGDREETTLLRPGVCLTLPLGTQFQFRSTGDTPLGAVGVTMPPWPGDGEAVVVAGPWEPSSGPLPALSPPATDPDPSPGVLRGA